MSSKHKRKPLDVIVDASKSPCYSLLSTQNQTQISKPVELDDQVERSHFQVSWTKTSLSEVA